MDWRGILKGMGWRPRKELGQSILVHEGTLDRLAREWEIGHGDEVFEIGTGPGNLTRVLSRRARRVWTVEIDPVLAAMARRMVRAPNIVWLEGDARVFLRHVRFGRPVRVAGNLPYAAYADLLLSILEWPGPVADVCVTLQDDVVRKLRLPGPLSLLLGARFEIRPGLRVSRDRFHPQPHVDSRSVRLIPRTPWRPMPARRLERGLKRLFASKGRTLAAFSRVEGLERPPNPHVRIGRAPADILLDLADRLTRPRAPEES